MTNPAATTTISSVEVPDRCSRTDLLRLLFQPDSVALIGASNTTAKLITHRPIAYLLRFGWTGSIYPINPKYHEVQGLPCYPSVHDTPTPPEVAIVALPRDHVLAALQECVDAGTRLAIVYSSGFSEVHDGLDLQEQITALCARSGLRVIGPNCQGAANLATGYLACFSTAFAADLPQSGRTAIISQSGAVAAMIYNKWTVAGHGAKYWIATGNEADLSVAQVAEAAIEDPEIDTLLLYLESLREATTLAAVAERARELGKHVVAYRSARTPDGWAAAGRHTGAGRTDDDIAQLQIPAHPHLHQASCLEELVATGQLAATGKTLVGNRLGVISNSGGLGVMVTDTAARRGFTLDPLAEATTTQLSAMLPGFASVLNPVDVTAQLLNDPSLLARALPIMLADEHVDAVVVALGAAGDGYDITQIRDDLARAQDQSNKPIVLIWAGSRVDPRTVVGDAGLPVYTDVGLALTALAAWRHATSADTSATDEHSPPQLPGPPSPGFGDLFPGATYSTDWRPIPPQSLDSYAAVAEQSDDHTNTHVSYDAARAAGHPHRVVSGLHTLTYLSVYGEELGLWAHSTVLAGFSDLRFRAAVHEGDALRLTLVVAQTKPLQALPGSGLVTFGFELHARKSAAPDSRLAVTGHVTYVFNPREN